MYVDDLILTGNDPTRITHLIHAIHGKFALKDLGLLNFFLGIQVTYVPCGLHLSQSKYIHDMLVKLKLEHINPYASPSSLGNLCLYRMVHCWLILFLIGVQLGHYST